MPATARALRAFHRHPFGVSVVLWVGFLAIAPAAQVASSEVPVGGERGQNASMVVDLITGYDDDITGELGGGSVGPREQVGGAFAGAGLSMTYSHQGARAGFGASGNGQFRHYNSGTAFNADSYGGGMGFSADLSRRTRMSTSIGMVHSPLMNFGLFPGLVDPSLGQVSAPQLDQVLSAERFTQYNGNANLAHKLTRRSSLDFHSGAQSSSGLIEDLNFGLWDVGGGYSYAMSEHLGLRLGYGYEQGRFGSVSSNIESLRYHTIDTGLDYTRPLSTRRETVLSFSIGSSVLDDGLDTQYNVTGSASIERELSRTWRLVAAYDRNLNYVPGFLAPVFGDSVSIRTRGDFGRRLSTSITVGYSDGNEVFSAGPSDYNTYVGTARLNISLARKATLFTEYLFYHYDFTSLASRPEGFPGSVDRQGIRVGMTVTPLLTERRRPRAPR